MDAVNKPKLLLDPYLSWTEKEGVPITEDFGVDLLKVPTARWPRMGVEGGIVHALPGGLRPQVQRVAARATAKTVIDILVQVHGKHPARQRARAVQRARSTRLPAQHPPRF